MSEKEQLAAAKGDFILQWGVLGSNWGISRSMAQAHALLLATEKPLSTDDLMAELGISRGNANTNLRDLVDWGLVRSVTRKGDRKEYFVADKDPWNVFRVIARERKRREIDPALAALRACTASTAALKQREARAFHQRISQLTDFVDAAARLLDRVAASPNNVLTSVFRKVLGLG